MRMGLTNSIAGAALATGLSFTPMIAAAQTPAARRQAYTPPRTPDGQPDLQGIWIVRNLAAYDLEDHPARPGVPAGKGVVVDPPDGKIPYKSEMLAKRKENFESSRTSDALKNADPLAKCYMPGVPRLTYLGWPFQIFQTSKYIAILSEWTHNYRTIYMDPKEKMEGVDFWLGTSSGHFEGNTLVVNVNNFNDRTWFDKAGNFHSEAMKVVERYTPIDRDTLQYEATIDDPKVFTRPWKISMPLYRQADGELLDYECHALLEETGIPLTWPRE